MNRIVIASISLVALVAATRAEAQVGSEPAFTFQVPVELSGLQSAVNTIHVVCMTGWEEVASPADPTAFVDVVNGGRKQNYGNYLDYTSVVPAADGTYSGPVTVEVFPFYAPVGMSADDQMRAHTWWSCGLVFDVEGEGLGVPTDDPAAHGGFRAQPGSLAHHHTGALPSNE